MKIQIVSGVRKSIHAGEHARKLLKRESTHDRIWRKELSKVQQTHDGIEKFGARTVKRGLTTDRRKPAAIVKIELTRWNDKLVNGAQERRAS